jgi:uncharacterized protein
MTLNTGRAWLAATLSLFIVAVAVLLGAPHARAAPVPIPEFTGWVIDQTNTLDAATKTQLSSLAADLDRRKGAQLGILMIPTTDGEAIESYARRAFDKWRLGREKIDDGILFVVAKDDRRLRIEVGYGLEGAVPDLLAGRIIREQVAPRFQAGDFAGGVTAGAQSLAKLIEGEPLPAPPPGVREAAGNDESPAVMLFPLAAMVFFMPAGLAALAAAVFVFLMFNSIGLALLGAAIAFVLSLIGRVSRAANPRSAARASRRGAALGTLGGFMAGRGGGGFGGGFGGGGGGGFGGGGGGGSGGGGASGSW